MSLSSHIVRASPEKAAACRASGWWGDETLWDMFSAAAAAGGAGEALVDPPNRERLDGQRPRRLSWRECAAEAEALAGRLHAAGLCAGDALVVQGPNVSELVLALLAAFRLGAVASPVALQYDRAELSRIADALDARLLLALGHVRGLDLAGRAREALPASVAVAQLSDLPAPARLPPPPRDADAAATVVWTSGTTGRSKGVPRSHNHWRAVGRRAGSGLGVQPGDRILCPFPFINMAAIGGCLVSWIAARGVLILHHPFDLAEFLQQVTAEKATIAIAPPAVLNMLLKEAERPGGVQPDFSGVRRMGSGSAPLAPWMVSGWQARGLPIISLFGSNEGTALIAGPETVPDPELRATCFPLADDAQAIEARLADPVTGEDLTEPGQPGELMVRGPTVFEGYLGMDRAEAEAERLFDSRGFFRTGDLFVRAEGAPGLVRFVARAKEIIIRGGMNVSMPELEAHFAGHPELAEAAAFPVPDEILGERIGLAVVARAGAAPGREALAAHLKTMGVSTLMWPEEVLVLPALPRNAMGKVLRAELTEMWQQQMNQKVKGGPGCRTS